MIITGNTTFCKRQKPFVVNKDSGATGIMAGVGHGPIAAGIPVL